MKTQEKIDKEKIAELHKEKPKEKIAEFATRKDAIKCYKMLGKLRETIAMSAIYAYGFNKTKVFVRWSKKGKPNLNERSLIILAYIFSNMKAGCIRLRDLLKIKRIKGNRFTKKDIYKEIDTLMWYGIIYQPKIKTITLQPWVMLLKKGVSR